MASSSTSFPSSDSSISLNVPLMAGIEVYDKDGLDALIAECHENIAKFGANHSSTALLASQIFLVIVGALAGSLYWDPAKACAEGVCDDTGLKNLIDSDLGRQLLYFLSGFIGYGSTNCTFAFYGPQEFVSMFSRQNSPIGKILGTGGVLSIMAMQGLQIFLAAKGTGSQPLTMTLSVLGALPGAIYGASGTVANVSTKVSQLSLDEIKKNVKHVLFDFHLKDLTSEERKKLAEEQFYAQQRKRFNAVLKANWEKVVANASKITLQKESPADNAVAIPPSTLVIKPNEDGLTFLLRQNAIPTPVSRVEKGFRGVTKVTELALFAAFTLPMLNNTYTEINKSIGIKELSGFLSVPLCWATIYGNYSLMEKARDVVTDGVVNAVKRKPVSSLVFQLRPVATTLTAIGSALTAAFSYAVVDMIWNNMYPPAEKGQWAFDFQTVGRIMARVGIDAYHAVGPADTASTHIIFRRLLKNGTDAEKFLAKLQLTVEYLTSKLPQDKFIEYVKDFSEEAKTNLWVETWEDFLGHFRGNLNNQSILKNELRAMGLSRFESDILEMLQPKSDVLSPTTPVQQTSSSASSKHWQSSTYVLPAPIAGGSVGADSDSEDDLDKGLPVTVSMQRIS